MVKVWQKFRDMSRRDKVVIGSLVAFFLLLVGIVIHDYSQRRMPIPSEICAAHKGYLIAVYTAVFMSDPEAQNIDFRVECNQATPLFFNRWTGRSGWRIEGYVYTPGNDWVQDYTCTGEFTWFNYDFDSIHCETKIRELN